PAVRPGPAAARPGGDRRRPHRLLLLRGHAADRPATRTRGVLAVPSVRGGHGRAGRPAVAEPGPAAAPPPLQLGVRGRRWRRRTQGRRQSAGTALSARGAGALATPRGTARAGSALPS